MVIGLYEMTRRRRWRSYRRIIGVRALCCIAGATAAQTPPAPNGATANPNSASTAPSKPPGPRPSATTKPIAARSSAAVEVLQQHNVELETLRVEQRKAAEAEQRLTIESDFVAEDQHKLSQSLVETAARIRTGEDRVASAETRLRQIEFDEADIRTSLEGRRAIISEVLAALQRIGRRPPPAVFAGSADAIESVRTAIALGGVLPQLRGETDKLLSDLAELTQLKNAKSVERDSLAAELAELGDAQKRMSDLIEARRKRQAEIEVAIGSERQRVLALAHEADNLKDLITKLERGLDAASRTARARQSGDPRTGEPRGSLAALNDPARMGPTVTFIAARGKLPLPANGVKIREFGVSDGMGGSEKGMSLATRRRAQVTAPSDGWVVYAAPYRSYGQLLILNVGGGYHVVLAGMERITAELGQFVLAGEPVAVMGNGTQVASNSAGAPGVGSGEPVLYIEFRKDGIPIDPGPWWMATENEKVRG